LNFTLRVGTSSITVEESIYIMVSIIGYLIMVNHIIFRICGQPGWQYLSWSIVNVAILHYTMELLFMFCWPCISI